MAKDEAKGSGQGSGAQGAEELRYIQQIYQNQYAVLTNSVNRMLQELQELNSAQKTVENIGLVQGREVLTGIGADSFLFGRIQDPKVVLMSVGAGYLVEKDIDHAKERMASLVNRRTENLNRLIKNRRELEAALIEISYRLEGLR